jgi:hypothetical protein
MVTVDTRSAIRGVESTGVKPIAVVAVGAGATVVLTVDPLIAGAPAVAATLSVPPRPTEVEAFRGVGNNIGVTATTRAVRSNAIESLLSIYGTGSKPPGRKG